MRRAGRSLAASPRAPPSVPPGFRREGRGVGWLSRWLRRGRGRQPRRLPARSPGPPPRSQDCRSRPCDARDAGAGGLGDARPGAPGRGHAGGAEVKDAGRQARSPERRRGPGRPPLGPAGRPGWRRRAAATRRLPVSFPPLLPGARTLARSLARSQGHGNWQVIFGVGICFSSRRPRPKVTRFFLLCDLLPCLPVFPHPHLSTWLHASVNCRAHRR